MQISREAYKIFVTSTDPSISTKMKQFWNFVNNSRKNVGYPNEMFYNDVRSDSHEDTVNLFAAFFQYI